MITFEAIKILDFMAIREVNYNFTEDKVRLLLGRNLDSIAADDNGAGKSSFAEALRWCLYGETTRQAIDKSLTVEHVIREGAKKAVVTVGFDVDGVFYEMTRTRTRSSQTMKLEVAEETFTGKEAQKQLLQGLGIDVIQFSNLVYLDGSYPLLFAPSTDRTRKDILADLVDVAATAEAQELVGKLLAPVKKDIDTLSLEKERRETRVSMLYDSMEQAKTRARAEKKDLTQGKEFLEGAQKQRDAGDDALTKAEAELLEVQGKARDNLDALQQAYEDADAESQDAAAALNGLELCYAIPEIDEIKSRINCAVKDHQVITNRLSVIERLQADGKCSTCGQDTETVMVDEQADLQEKAKDLTDAIRRDRRSCEKLESKRESKINAASRVAREANRVREEVFAALREAGKDPAEIELAEKVSKARKQHEENERILTTVLERIRNTRRAIETIREDFNRDKAQQELLVAEREERDELMDSLVTRRDNLEFWRKGFGPKGVASLFIETVLPRISQRIQQYANILTGGDLSVSLRAFKETKSSTVQESIQISAINAKGASVYGANSAGERNRINLAVTLGLISYFRDMGVFESNLLICDEIFDGLDQTGVVKALFALKDADMEHVIVVSHHNQLKPLFPEAMYMTKEHGEATLEV